MGKATFPAQSQSVAESTKPADGDGFTPADHRNAYSALYQGDLGVMRPRAKSPATLAINVAAAELEGFYRNVYWNNDHVKFAGGDSPNFTAPTSNPRIDLLVLDVSGGPTGALTRIAGTEAASPAEPALPDLKTNIPLCYVYNRVGQTKIVSFEDKDANPTEGYIYQDVRPWVPPGGGATLGGTPTSSAVGDAATEGTSANGAKADHRHGREGAGTPVTQAFGDSPAAGSGPSVAYAGHRHGMPADPASPRADNLIKNGSFESYTGNVPDNWTRGGTNPASGTGQDTALGQFGDSCDRFVVEPSSTSTLLQSVVGTISAARNAYFRGKTFSLWVRVKNVSGIGSAYFRLGVDDGVSLQEGAEVLLGDDVWTTVEFTAAISANATKLEAVLKFRNGHSTFTSSFRCDGACLVLGSKAAEFVPHWSEAADPHA